MHAIHILLAEDNEADILLIQEALEVAKIRIGLSVVRDGKAAIDFLSQHNCLDQTCQPDLLLLDINMPKKNGHEVLQSMKSNESLKHIPVIMLTTSSADADKRTARINEAQGYITKPFQPESFLKTVCEIAGFWISLVKYPVKFSPDDKRS